MSEPQIAVMSHLVQAGHGYLWLSDYRKCCDPPQVGQLGKLFWRVTAIVGARYLMASMVAAPRHSTHLTRTITLIAELTAFRRVALAF